MFFRNRWLQLSPLSALLAGIGIIALRPKYSLLDYDIWWHLKVGDWIVDNLSLPHSGILSRTAARPWAAYSWGYEVLLSRAYAWFGLVGIGAYGTLLTMALPPLFTGCCGASPAGSGFRACLPGWSVPRLVQRHAAPGLLFNDAVLRDADTFV